MPCCDGMRTLTERVCVERGAALTSLRTFSFNPFLHFR